MILSSNRVVPTYYWEHDSDLQDNYKWTVAMYLANNGVSIP